MPVDPQLRSLDIDIPAQPNALVQLSMLLSEEDVNLREIGTLIEGDMALAAAVLKAVNSSLYGLKGRVQTVHQAISYLGTREIAAVTYEFGLRAVFRHAPELDALWRRSGLRGLVMGRLAQLLSVDAWAAHSAGLFEECGKAVLFRHSPEHYGPMLRAAADDAELLTLEHAGFGVSHAALGSALCEGWGLAASAVASVRHHVHVQQTGDIPPNLQRPAICALSALARSLIEAPQTMEDVALQIAPQAQLDDVLALRAMRRVREQIDTATTAAAQDLVG